MNQSIVTTYPVTDRVQEALQVSLRGVDELLPQARLWLHGHLHAPSNYLVQGQHADGAPWQCRVVANPLGYARKGEQAQFFPRHCVALSLP